MAIFNSYVKLPEGILDLQLLDAGHGEAYPEATCCQEPGRMEMLRKIGKATDWSRSEHVFLIFYYQKI